MPIHRPSIRSAAILFSLLLATGLTAQTPDPFADQVLSQLTWRNIGPFRQGGWIVDLAVPESPVQAHLYTLYAATRNGGLYKTVNNGSSWASVFHQPDVHALGAVAVAPSNPDIVWLGTGDSYYARSSYAGNGVYKSTDGGKTWTHCGLPESHHIGKIIIHPKNPDIVYVAAMGHLFTPNEERGVFKTTDGGKTWHKVLYINENTGVVDMAVHPAKPDILYAATYEKYRYPWTFVAGGPQSGIYKTTDGGKKWTRLGGGLPTGNIGRIGVDICRTKPNVVYAVIENVNLRDPLPSEIEQESRRNIESKPRPIGGEVYRSDDSGKTWRKMNRPEDNVGGKAAYSFNTLRVDPNNDKTVYVTGLNLQSTTDGGLTWHGVEWTDTTKVFGSAFGDVRTAWVDPQNSQRVIIGSDGGIHISYDGGKTCDHYDNLPVGEVYALGVDTDEPYNVYAGLQDHDSWKGPSNAWSGLITLENWTPVGNGDGMYNQVDPENNRWVYNNTQFGDHHRLDQWTGDRVPIEPQRNRGEAPYRWNWTPPIHISPHNSRIIYTGAEVLLRSLDQGDHWQPISPDLTTNNPDRINGQGHIQFCTITTISESPVQAGVIWVGTDDGKVWLTTDFGADWRDMTSAVADAGGPEGRWVSRVCASRHSAGTAYVCKNGFRNDDFKPYVFQTTDFGRTWTLIARGLPDAPVNVIAEDPKNPHLLFLGNDRGVYLSLTGGKSWQPFKNNMPTVPVHDLVVHPRENDLVAGTYGRSIFIADISPLQEWKNNILGKDLYLFDIEPKPWRREGALGANYQLYGDRHLMIPNEPNGMTVYFFLKEEPTAKVRIRIADAAGQTVNEWEMTAHKGLNAGFWNMRKAGPRWRAPLADPGEYTVTVQSGGFSVSKQGKFTGIVGWKK
ncbi:MAG: hypothetical protein KDD12_24575 [Lewinella sp.]|nr:hypothetical protein [Lewinella sp.]